MKKLIAITIAIIMAMPSQALALRPMAAKESFKKRNSQVAQYLCPVCKETERDRTQILYETENFIVVPDRGPLSLGHLLISPKNHALSMSMLDEAQLMELEILHSYVRHILANAYNRDVIFFEHGSVSEDEIRVMQGGNSITHAHLHAIPVPRGFDILRKLTKRSYLSVKPISSFHDLVAQYVAEATYFFYEDPQGEKYVIELEESFKAPAQFLRLIIGEELGYPARGNWKLADDEIRELYQEWVQRAKSDLLFKFKKLPESKDILFVDESFPGPISEEAIEMFEKLSDKVNYQFSDESCESIDDVEDIAPLRVYYFERRGGASIDARRSSTLWPRGTTPYDWRVGSTFTTSQTYDNSQKQEVLTWHVKESSLGCNVCNIPPDEILFKTKEEMDIMPVAVNIHPVARNNILLYTKEPQGQYLTPKRIKQILYFGQKVLGNGWSGYWNAIFGAANLHFHAHFHQSGSGLRDAIHNGRASLINRRVRDGVTSAVIKGWHTSGVLFRGNDIEKITEQAWLLLENLTAKNISYNIIYYFDRDEITFVVIPRRKVLVDDLKVGLQELLGQEAIGAASNTMIGAYDLDGNLFICNKELFDRIKNTPEVRRKIAMLYSRALGKAGYSQDDTMRLYDETFKRMVVPKRADGKKVFAERAKRSEGDLFLAVGDLDKMQCMNRIYGKKIFGDENKGVLGKIFEVMINTSRKYGVDLYRYLSGDEFGITSRAKMAAQEFNTMLLEVRKRVKAISSQYAICMVENVSENALSILKDIPTVIEVDENEEGGANVLFRLYETESLEDALKRISEDITTALSRQVSVKRHWFNNGYLWIPTLSIGARHIKEDFERTSEQAPTDIFENIYASAMEEAALISKEAKKTRDTSIVVWRKDEIAGVIKKEKKGESILKEEAKGAILEKIELPKQERDFYDPLTGLLRQEALEGDMISHGVGKGKTFLEITDTCYTSERFVEQKHRRIKWGSSFKGKRLGARIMAINEFYGDDAGDEAIRLIAKAVKENLPEQWAGKVRLARAPPDKIQILIDDIVDKHDVIVFLDSVQQRVNNTLKDGITARIKAVMIPTDNVNDATELLSCVEPLRKIEEGISILPSRRETSHPGTGNVLAVYDIQPGDTHKKAIYKEAYTRFRREDTREAAQELRDTYGGRLQIPLHLPKTKWEGLQKMVIVIAGMHGSGKNTAAELLAQQTGLRMYNVGDLKRKMALERGFDSIKAYNAYLTTNPHEQREVDGFLDEIQKYEITKGGVIINSFFGPYVVGTLKDELRKRGIKVIKVLLTCPPEMRAQRVSSGLRMGDAAGDFKQVFRDLAERDQKDLNNLASITGGVDAANKSYDPSNYDIVRDTSQKGADQVCQDILDFASDLIEREYIPATREDVRMGNVFDDNPAPAPLVHNTVQGPELIPATALLAIEAAALRPTATRVTKQISAETLLQEPAQLTLLKQEKGFRVFDCSDRKFKRLGKTLWDNESTIVEASEQYNAWLCSCAALVVFNKEGKIIGISHLLTGRLAVRAAYLDKIKDILTPDNYFLIIHGTSGLEEQRAFIESLVSYLVKEKKIAYEHIYCHESRYYEKIIEQGADARVVVTAQSEQARLDYVDSRDFRGYSVGTEIIRRAPQDAILSPKEIAFKKAILEHIRDIRQLSFSEACELTDIRKNSGCSFKERLSVYEQLRKSMTEDNSYFKKHLFYLEYIRFEDIVMELEGSLEMFWVKVADVYKDKTGIDFYQSALGNLFYLHAIVKAHTELRGYLCNVCLRLIERNIAVTQQGIDELEKLKNKTTAGLEALLAAASFFSSERNLARFYNTVWGDTEDSVARGVYGRIKKQVPKEFFTDEVIAIFDEFRQKFEETIAAIKGCGFNYSQGQTNSSEDSPTTIKFHLQKIYCAIVQSA